MDGSGKKDEADEAATSAMRDVFDTVPMKGTVVIGEGEMDEAPMLYIGKNSETGTARASMSQLTLLKAQTS